MSKTSTTPIQVSVSSQPRTADEQDFQPISTTVHFNPGETVKTIQISITDDSFIEINESFALSLFNVQGATYTYIGPSIVTIIDNEAQLNISSSLQSINVQATRAYQWSVNINPAADALPLNPQQTETIQIDSSITRDELGPVLYNATGVLQVTNQGNIQAELAQVVMIVTYRLDSATVYSTTYPLALTSGQQLAVGQTVNLPFTATWTFNTNDGSVPATLSDLQLESRIELRPTAGPPPTSFGSTAALPTTLLQPQIIHANVTAHESIIVQPSSAATDQGATRDTALTQPSMQLSSTYTVTRVTTEEASLRYSLELIESGIQVQVDIPLQASESLHAATFEFKEIEPRVTHTQDSIPYTATLKVRLGLGFDPATPIHLIEKNPDGSTARVLGQFYDDGLHGDELAQDGIYGTLTSIEWATAGPKQLAAQTQLLNGEIVTLDAPFTEVVTKRPQAEWDTYFDVLEQTTTKWQALSQQYPLAEAQHQLQTWVELKTHVVDTLLTEQTLVITYNSGLSNSIYVGGDEEPIFGGGAASSTTQPQQPAPMIPIYASAQNPIFTKSNRAIVLNSLPNYTLAILSMNQVTNYLRSIGYATAVYDYGTANLGLYMNLDEYGVVHSIGHGSYHPDLGVVKGPYSITANELVNQANRKQYQDMVAAGWVGTASKDGKSIYILYKKFFNNLYTVGSLPNTLVTLIHCNSYEMGELFLNKGAAGFVGFDNYVPADTWTWGADGINELYRLMTEWDLNLGDAYSLVPAHLKTIEFNYKGRSRTTNLWLAPGSQPHLKLSAHGFINGDFEMGSLAGWSYRQGSWVNAFLVPDWAQPNHGYYAAHIGKMIYPPACGTCNPTPGTTHLSQFIDILPQTRYLSFDYAYSTYLPSAGHFEVAFITPQGTEIATYELARYPGSDWKIRQDFWHTEIQHANINMRHIFDAYGYSGERIKVEFRNSQQQNGSQQTVYLDNVRIDDD